MESTTKERILDAALVRFSESGYRGTNLRDFAAGMGLSKSALYRHYESKEAIWEALLDRMEAYYTAGFGSPDHMPETPKSWDELFSLTMRMVSFTIRDERIIRTRKLLLTEQFHDERVKSLATGHFFSGTRAMFKSIFEKMTGAGLLIDEDSDMLALAFTAPITSLIHYCDREPEKEPEIMEQIAAFIRHFINQYGKADRNG